MITGGKETEPLYTARGMRYIGKLPNTWHPCAAFRRVFQLVNGMFACWLYVPVSFRPYAVCKMSTSPFPRHLRQILFRSSQDPSPPPSLRHCIPSSPPSLHSTPLSSSTPLLPSSCSSVVCNVQMIPSDCWLPGSPPHRLPSEAAASGHRCC